MSPPARLAVVAMLGLLSTGCPDLGPHTCRDDTDCDRGGEGRCFEGACAYPDSSCPSEYAYSPNADVDGERCVPQLCTSLAVTVDAAALDLEEALVDYPLVVRLPSEVSELGPPTSVSLEGIPLPFELASSAMTLHTKLPELAPNAMLTLRVGFGEDDATDLPSTQVWSPTFRGVWHLDDELTGAEGNVLLNAAVPDEVGLVSGEIGPEGSVEGIIGPAVAFDGVDDFASFQSEFLGNLDAFTISMWARVDLPEGTAERVSYFEGLNGDGLYPRCWRAEDQRTQCQLRTQDSTDAITLGADAPPAGQFAHLALVLDPQARVLQLFLDGELAADVDVVGALVGGDESLDLARGQWGFSPLSVDELRISDRAVSPSWLRADVRTHRDSVAVLRFAEAETTACSP